MARPRVVPGIARMRAMLAEAAVLSFAVALACDARAALRASAASRSTSRTSARCTSGRCRAPAASRCSPAPRARSRSARPTLWLPMALALGAGRRSRSPTTCAACRPGAAGRALSAAAALLVLVRAQPDASRSSCCVLVLAVVWMANLYNFMDGSDGLAGGMAVIGFGAYALAARLAGARRARRAVRQRSPRPRPPFSLSISIRRASSWATSARCRSASSPRALGIVGWRDDWPLWFPLLVFSPFIVDATLTLLQRLLRRESVWHAHREPLLPAPGAHGLGPPRGRACSATR